MDNFQCLYISSLAQDVLLLVDSGGGFGLSGFGLGDAGNDGGLGSYSG